MTTQDENLIAEARGKQCGCSGDYCDAGLVRRLADALEAVTRERDAALAAIERVRAIHMRTAFDDAPEEHHCKRCQITAGTWPCQTVMALDEAHEPEAKP